MSLCGSRNLSNLSEFNQTGLAIGNRTAFARESLNTNTSQNIIDLLSTTRKGLIDKVKSEFKPEKDPTGELTKYQIEKTAKDHAPWYIVPADDKEMSRYIIAKIIWEEIQKLTDKHIKEIDLLIQQKEKEIMEV